MHDYKYGAIAWTALRDRTWNLKDFRSECLRPIALAFLTNLTRTSRFALMPAHLALLARNDQLWRDYIDTTLGRSINPESKKYSPREFSNQEVELIRPLLEKYSGLPDSESKELIQNVGIAFVEDNLKRDNDMRESMTAVLSTIVLESWTAFEMLASDLWVAAINKGPRELASRVMMSKRWLKSDDQLTPEKVYHLEHDPRTQLGSFLLEIGRVSFSKLNYILRYYSDAFGKDVEEVFEEVEGGYIFALSAFRNALIHNAGKTDKHFVNRIARFSEFRSIVPNEVLMLDGEVVRKLHNSAIVLGWKLIGFVDDVLTPR